LCSGGFQGTEVQPSTKADRCTEVKHWYFCHHYTKPMLCAVFLHKSIIMKSISNETDFKELVNEYVNLTKDKGYSLPIEVIPELIELAERGKHRMVYFYLRVVQGMMYGFAIKQAVEYSDKEIMSILKACEWVS